MVKTSIKRKIDLENFYWVCIDKNWGKSVQFIKGWNNKLKVGRHAKKIWNIDWFYFKIQKIWKRKVKNTTC